MVKTGIIFLFIGILKTLLLKVVYIHQCIIENTNCGNVRIKRFAWYDL